MDEMDEIIEEFLVESRENLDRLDADFIRLEDNPDDVDILAAIFRDIHTIKGTSGFLGYSKLESVAHVGENLLSLLRDGERRLTAARTTALLKMVDAIREILAAIDADGTEGPGEYSGIVAAVEAASADTTPAIDETDDDEMPSIGRVLQETAGVDPEELIAATQAQQEGDPRRIGEILVERGVIDGSAVVEALHVQEEKKNEAPARAADTTIRVDVDLLDNLMNLVGELVLARNQIMQVGNESLPPALADTAQRLNLITTELQDSVMKTRMQPIGNVFSKFPRVVRDIAHSLGKQVKVTMEGTDTELDKTIIEAIKDPLTHMVRNSVDHGIESPEDRESSGKSSTGSLLLRAYHEGGQVNIEITDDGGGINPDQIARKAVEKGIISADQARHMSERELVNLVFAPGFSTAEKVSNLSGRGVGMDVVRTSIERIGGSVDITSDLGVGTTTRIRIPLTLAIIPALMVSCGGEKFAIPQVNLLELVRLEAAEAATAIEYIHGVPVHRLRGRLLPLVYLDSQLGLPSTDTTNTSIVVLQAEDQQFGLVVDDIADNAEIVVKPLGQVLKSLDTYAGATILGDGHVALILDVLGIAERAGISGAATAHFTEDTVEADRQESESLLLFNVGAGDDLVRMAVRLIDVARLEEIDIGSLELAGGRPVVQYRGAMLPLVWMSDVLGLPRATNTASMLQVVVWEDEHSQVGFIVENIEDVLETQVRIERPSTTPGTRGSAIIAGRVTDLMDVTGVIGVAAPDLLPMAVGV